MSMSTLDLIVSDLVVTFDAARPSTRLATFKLLAKTLLTVKGIAITGTRLAFAAGQRKPALGAAIKQVTHLLTGVDIGPQAVIGPGLRLLHPTGVVVDGRATIGARCTLHPSTVGATPDGSPSIGDDVMISPGARIFGDVRVGNGCRVGANAVLLKTFEGDNLRLVGVPVREATPVRETTTRAPSH